MKAAALATPRNCVASAAGELAPENATPKIATVSRALASESARTRRRPRAGWSRPPRQRRTDTSVESNVQWTRNQTR